MKAISTPSATSTSGCSSCPPPLTNSRKGRSLDWSPDGRGLIDSVAKQGRRPLVRVDTQSGTVTEITHGDQAILDFCVAPDTPTVVALASTPVMIGDLFTVAANGPQTRITDFNRQLWSQLDLTAPEEIDYTSFDGKRIQGWIQKPPDFDPQKKYPLILNIHGGPHAAYGWVFDHEFQWMAAKGYVVLYVNPRGSTSDGQDFGNITNFTGAAQNRNVEVGLLVQSRVLSERLVRFFEALVESRYFVRAI